MHSEEVYSTASCHVPTERPSIQLTHAGPRPAAGKGNLDAAKYQHRRTHVSVSSTRTQVSDTYLAVAY